MPKTITPPPGEADKGFSVSRGNPDGTVTLYYPGDTVPPLPPSPPSIPAEVTMRQARLALHAAGKLSAVEAAIDSMPEPQKTQARITWDHSQTVQRYNGLVSQMGPALGLTSAQIDALFIAAAQL